MKTRTVELRLHYESVDISADLKPHLLGWSYTDNLSGEADDLQIELEDREQLWIGTWAPETGAKVTATIYRMNWTMDGEKEELPLGEFEIDEITSSFPPSVVSIKALSVPESSSLRGEQKSRAWEKTHLSVVARDIAGAKIKLFYQTDDDPDYDRVEQAGETDLSFLMRLCTDAGLCLKVSDAQIIIFDERLYEKQEPVTTIRKYDRDIKSYSGRITLNGSYRSCRVQYTNAKKKQTIKYEYVAPNPPPTKRVLIVHERVTSIRAAELLAKKKLRQSNKEAVTVALTMMGDPRFAAGQTVTLADFGKFDGKYIITQAIHFQQGGYQTKLALRKCLEGY